MGCAGVTTFNGLRSTRAKAGDLVAVLGIGGLGHLGVQFSRAMGFETVAIARGAARRPTTPRNWAPTTTSTRTRPTSPPSSRSSAARRWCSRRRRTPTAMAATVGGLAPQGELVTVGVTPDDLPISPLDLINAGPVGDRAPVGHVARRRGDHALRGAVRRAPVIEERPLAQAAEAYEAMDTGKARYRMVLTV